MSAPTFIWVSVQSWMLWSWDEGLHLSSDLWDFATSLGVQKWFLSKEGGCPATEDISSAL